MIMKNTTYQNSWNVVKTNHKEKPTDVNAYIRNKREVANQCHRGSP